MMALSRTEMCRVQVVAQGRPCAHDERLRIARPLRRSEVVEAAGVEPASRSPRAPSVYVCSPRFESRPPGARGQAPLGPASEKSRRSAPRRSSPASPLIAFPRSRGHSAGKRQPVN